MLGSVVKADRPNRVSCRKYLPRTRECERFGALDVHLQVSRPRAREQFVQRRDIDLDEIRVE